MPAINWFLATMLVLLACGLAIAAPFLLGLWGAA
jgi:hypothetical protein